MPVMDGLEACRRIFQRHRNRQGEGGPLSNQQLPPKVIFLTAQVTQDFKNECREAGAVSFLSKPCTLDSMKKCLQEFGNMEQ
jgi:CheY-like chemotaxis protein